MKCVSLRRETRSLKGEPEPDGANAVTALQRPVFPSHVALLTSVHPLPHLPARGGPHAGRGH